MARDGEASPEMEMEMGFASQRVSIQDLFTHFNLVQQAALQRFENNKKGSTEGNTMRLGNSSRGKQSSKGSSSSGRKQLAGGRGRRWRAGLSKLCMYFTKVFFFSLTDLHED